MSLTSFCSSDAATAGLQLRGDLRAAREQIHPPEQQALALGHQVRGCGIALEQRRHDEQPAEDEREDCAAAHDHRPLAR
jgi:hypothetical protein